MKITNIVFNNTNEQDASLREDFEKSMAVLCENLAIAMAEERRWSAIKAVASESLSEGMDLLEIKEMQSSMCTFVNHDEGLEVIYHGEALH
tara:strand:- start:3896 stop:4168 length:273 start_codon:yes stop_codon:yes gene_type:complete